jgi:predicted nuclease of restriction endonuclease-like (RecB) superfamily
MNFEILVNSIQQTHQSFQQQAVKAVNINLTIRNWLIGYYIVEFEQKGEDRAKYGEQLIATIALNVKIKGLAETNLKLCRQFYNLYPGILLALFRNSEIWLPFNIRQLLTDELQKATHGTNEISQSLTDESQLIAKLPLLTVQSDQNLPAGDLYYLSLIERSSFTHFVELLKIEDKTKRRFYELLILKTTPSVKELQRQINTLAYERTGLSLNTESAFSQLQQKIDLQQPGDAVKSVYFFDFLGLKVNQLLEEKDLETALINHLQEFILELGHGFCFEARQQRMLIDDEYYFVDLVFYHRILKCHVLIDLKIDAFKHAHLSQLNAYVAYYREEVKKEDDNPPIGILLCTEKGKKLVEYALSGMDEKHFVSKYLLQLPDKEQLAGFIQQEIAKWKD